MRNLYLDENGVYTYLAEEPKSALANILGAVAGAATTGSNIPEFKVNLELEPQAKTTLFATAGILAAGAIITAAILRK